VRWVEDAEEGGHDVGWVFFLFFFFFFGPRREKDWGGKSSQYLFDGEMIVSKCSSAGRVATGGCVELFQLRVSMRPGKWTDQEVKPREIQFAPRVTPLRFIDSSSIIIKE
jgi:hypothetical protein